MKELDMSTSKTHKILRHAAICLSLMGPALSMALEPGQAAPAFSLPQAGAGQQTLADLKGQVIYLDFWASWCGPCRQSFPWMNEMQAKYGNKGFKVLAINVDAKTADAEQFLAQTPARFAVAFDAKGETPGRYAIKGMPSSVLIGADGKVISVHAGFKQGDREELEKQIAAALGNGSAAGAR
jgi:cytochrome c biogenesis protein CcmG/thiol:disulfide interchange protein DsbE